MEGWQHHFQNVMADGEIWFGGEDYEGAREFFQEAFKLIPEPQYEYSESTQAIGALADCFYFLEDFKKARAALEDILICPGGAGNPFIRLRRGQVFHRLGDLEKARVELTTAYLNGGRDVFEDEAEYLNLISDVISELDEK